MTVGIENILVQLATTRKRLESIEQELHRYLDVVPRRKCRSSLTMPEDEVNYGIKLYTEQNTPMRKLPEILGYSRNIIVREFLKRGVKLRGIGTNGSKNQYGRHGN